MCVLFVRVTCTLYISLYKIPKMEQNSSMNSVHYCLSLSHDVTYHVLLMWKWPLSDLTNFSKNLSFPNNLFKFPEGFPTNWWSFAWLGFQEHFSRRTEWFIGKFSTLIHAPLRMNCNNFGNPLTFPLASKCLFVHYFVLGKTSGIPFILSCTVLFSAN